MILTIISVLVAILGALFETSWADTSLLVSMGLIATSIIWRRKDIF